jgi:hypothetical protein
VANIASEVVAPPLGRLPRIPSLPRWRIMLWLLALTVLVGLLAASWLAYIAGVSTSSYYIQRLRAEREVWRMKNDQLELELAKVRSLTWVEHEAVSRLQMRRPSELTYLQVDLGQPPAAGAGRPR